MTKQREELEEGAEQVCLAEKPQEIIGWSLLGGAGFFAVPEARKAMGRSFRSWALGTAFLAALDDGRLPPWNPGF